MTTLRAPRLLAAAAGFFASFLWLSGRAGLTPTGVADALYVRGRYVQCAALTRPLAAAGDAHAAELLGLMALRGRGMPLDERAAARHFRRAAAGGRPRALAFLGLLAQRDGRYAEAAAFYGQAARLGASEGLAGLSTLYSLGVLASRRERRVSERS